MTGANRASWSRWLGWAVIAGITTSLLLVLRESLDKVHFALAYLLLVLAATVTAGYRVGLALAAASFLLFNWFFLPPYNTLYLANPIDWFVLASFLIVSVVASRLLHRSQVQARVAENRAAEIDQFATLGAETLNVARAGDALAAIAAVIRDTTGVSDCRILMAHAGGERLTASGDSMVAWVLETGGVAMRHRDGTTHVSESPDWSHDFGSGVQQLLLPLRVRDRTVGVLEVGAEELVLDASQRRMLTGLAYYAALAAERARLETEAGHAESLREANRLKNALLASVSHDLRTPLTTIKAVAHELARGDGRAMVIEEEADRLNRMVADLLDLSRVQSGTSVSAVEINAVDDLVGAALQRVSGALAHRNVQVQLEDGGTLLVGRFDFAATLRIIVNLLENADKYSPVGAPIDLGVLRAGPEIEITIADRGPGVTEAERQRIFEPFYRSPGPAAEVRGAGLGLAIARGLAEAQSGELRYAPRPGGGSRFILTLPAADLPEPDLAA